MAFNFIASNKPVVLLLHGFLGSQEQWDFISPYLKTQYDVLLVELPGHGNAATISEYTIEDLASEIAQYLVEQSISKVHFVGHSMGGYVGAAFAKAYPQHLHSLTMVNSIASADLPARKQMRNRAIQLIDRFQDAYVSMAINNLFTREEHDLHESLIEQMKVRAKGMKVESVLAALRAMRDRSTMVLDDQVAVQYIYGNRDEVIAKLLVEKELKAGLKNGAKLDGGHMLIVTHSDEIVQNMHFIE